jgi:membrane-bound lytic murein transglycosylase D
MRKTHLLLLLCCWVGSVIVGCASVTSTGQLTRDSKQSRPHIQKDLDELSEREKWSQARKAYAQAQEEEKYKHTDNAAAYYELTLQLLGSLDPGSLSTPTATILEFQRKVLNSYDKFLASIESLPPNSDRLAVLESGADSLGEDLDLSNPTDRDSTPTIPKSRNALPGVPRALNERVRSQISFFQGKGRKVMLTWMERAATVLPRLRPILREEGIPEDMIYLSMIESGLNMHAYSYAHASGLWQFIPGTARIYGLHVDRMYDERRHVELATRASCRYLRKLYEEFGDWYLAMAGYNCGEFRVEREIKRSKTRDYWSLNHLPRQTRSYVPIFLAAREICMNPTDYGFPKPPREKPFECERIWVNGGSTLDQIAQASGVDASTVKELNPEFLRSVLPRSSSPFMIRLPQKPRADFDVRLAAMPKVDVLPTTEHRVRKGETLASIAKRYNTTVAAIKGVPENRKTRSGKLKVGQKIVIPVPTEIIPSTQDKASTEIASTEVFEPKSESKKQKPANDQIVYTVHAGETLGKIARQLGVSVEQICRENKIKNRNQVAPGQRLKITVEVSPDKIAADKKYYTVQPGDTVWSIAQAHGQDATKIITWNKLDTDKTIHPGQKLVVGVK